MKKRAVIAIALLILFSTITSQNKIKITKFNLETIQIKNNSILKEKDINELLIHLYGKNLIFLSYVEIEKALMSRHFGKVLAGTNGIVAALACSQRTVACDPAGVSTHDLEHEDFG